MQIGRQEAVMSNLNSPLISVIVPVYNVEKYLNKCLESVYGQSYGNYEVLMVWDSGTKRERDMCLIWQQKDARFRLIERENGGLSAARNTALDCCIGDIIVFLDSDDYMKPDCLERTATEMAGNDCGIVQFDLMLTDETESYIKPISFQTAYGVHPAKEMILDLAEGSYGRSSVPGHTAGRCLIISGSRMVSIGKMLLFHMNCSIAPA